MESGSVDKNGREKDRRARSQQKGVTPTTAPQGSSGRQYWPAQLRRTVGLATHQPTIHGEMILGSQCFTLLTCPLLRPCELRKSICKSHWHTETARGCGWTPALPQGWPQAADEKCLRYYLGFLLQCSRVFNWKLHVLANKTIFINPLSILFANSIFKPKFIVIMNLGWVLGAEIKT